MKRAQTRQVHVGQAAIGGGAPITIQSMTNTDTRDPVATIAQIRALVDAGLPDRPLHRAGYGGGRALKAIGPLAPSPWWRTCILTTGWHGGPGKRGG